MSSTAAEAFGISQPELLEFLQMKKSPLVDPPAIAVTNHSKHIILVVSIFLFSLAFFTCICTLVIWAIAKKRREKGKGYKPLEATEKPELVCSEESLSDSLKGTPSLPQIFLKPKVTPNASSTPKVPFDGEELRKLRVENLDATASYYVNRNQLQVNVRRVNLNAVDENLAENAFVYLVVSLLPEKNAYYESELRPVAEENYFEEASEFDISMDGVPTKTLQISVYASDRFSQHRLVNEFTYRMCVEEDPEAETQKPILPVVLTETSRSEDNEIPEKIVQEGEVLFSLCYMPTSGRLTFVALKGRNMCDRNEAPVESYLRVSLLVSGKTMKTVQTTSFRKSASPVYNEAFVFHTPLERIKDTDIIVSVMTSPPNGPPKMLGKLIVGPESGNNLGRKHWEAMLTTPRKPVAQWHSITEFL